MRCPFLPLTSNMLFLKKQSVLWNPFYWSREPARSFRHVSIALLLLVCLLCSFWVSSSDAKPALSMQRLAPRSADEQNRDNSNDAQPDAYESSAFNSGHFVLQLKSNPSAEELDAIRAKFNLSSLSPFSNGGSDLWSATVDVIASSASFESNLADDLVEDDLILFAEPEILFTAYGLEFTNTVAAESKSEVEAVTPNDTYYDQQWALEAIQLSEAWETTTGSSEIIVAVLDSGAEMDHPDLVGNLIAGYDFVNDDNQPWDDLGHGTHVASVIGGLTNNGEGTAGINWHVKVMPIKVLNERGVGSVQHIIEGFDFAIANGADVINLSLGAPETSRFLRRTVRQAVEDEGIVVVAASGNEFDQGNPISYPAAYEEVIAVGATDEDGNHASFSSSGTHLDLAAPGVEILAATWTGSGSEYAYYTGTSMSAPIVSGVVSLMLAADSALSPAQISTLLTANAQDVGAFGWDEFSGHGIVNASASIGAVSGADVSTPTATLTPTPTSTLTPTSTPMPTPTITPTPTPPSVASDPTREPTGPNTADSDFTIFLPLLTR